ncbi:hypothetical protein ACHQM5_001294 [Ranunculus cassubicifolius]
MLALRAVQRHTAASRSARPWIRVQQGATGGEPTITLTNPSTFAHTPSLSVSLGQTPFEGLGVGVGFGCGFGCGFGIGPTGVVQVLQALTKVKKRMLSDKNRASDA